jgi:hypothetical protein
MDKQRAIKADLQQRQVRLRGDGLRATSYPDMSTAAMKSLFSGRYVGVPT